MKPQRGKTPKKTAPAPPKKDNQKDPVEVFCRVKPIFDSDPLCCEIVDNTTLKLTPPEGSNTAKNGFIKEMQYTFSYVFPSNTTQKNIFHQVAYPLVDDVLKGRNALLFAYGVTSSGKTHTMTGSAMDQGILPRCLDVIFNSIGELQAKKYVFKPDKANGFDVQTEADALLERQRRDLLPRLMQTPTKPPPTPKFGRSDSDGIRVPEATCINDVEEDNNYAVFVSYVEIYNNYIYDLLEELQYDPITGYKPPQSKNLREDSQSNMYVSSGTEVEVKSTEEAQDVLQKGQKRRKVAHTTLNTESSRSHSVFSIRVVQAPLDPQGREVLQDKSKVIVSQLSLVDLAGSERTGRTGNQGDRLKEAGNINQSLMVLRSCMEVLRDNQQNNSNKLVPYRDSRMTHLFKNYFDGEGKVRMIVCLNPKACEYDESLQVMKFAVVTQEVQIARPTQVRFDVGLTPGRRRLALERATTSEEEDERPIIISYNFDPFPNFELSDFTDSSQLSSCLVDYLMKRAQKRNTYLIDHQTKESAFRDQLLQMETEYNRMKSVMEDQEKQIEALKAEKKRLMTRNSRLEQELSLGENERQDLRSKMLTMTPARSDTDLSSKTGFKAPVYTRERPPLARPTPSKPMYQSRTTSTPRPRSPPPTKPVSVKPVYQAHTQRSRSPPPTKPKPQVDAKYRRRSKSQGDVWLDHRPVDVADTGTVMQPMMKKRKSVSKLERKDLERTNRYALTTQEIDSDGGIATNIIKGEIGRSSGGGTTVVYTDVEQIRQRSPGDRKRRSPPPVPQDMTGEWTDTDERCRIAIEGHSLPKRGRKQATAV